MCIISLEFHIGITQSSFPVRSLRYRLSGCTVSVRNSISAMGNAHYTERVKRVSTLCKTITQGIAAKGGLRKLGTSHA
jgi:hypothetical protein